MRRFLFENNQNTSPTRQRWSTQRQPVSPSQQSIIWGALFLLSLTLTVFLSSRPFGQPSQAVSVTTSRTAIVHLFEWTWNDIAQECEAFLGPNGYEAVQISPPNEHLVLTEKKFPWWQRYQPVSYRLVSRSGDRTQLQSMIHRCHAVGVKIYADAVINHMSGMERGVGSAGSTFTKYSYPGIYTSEDFHPCRKNITDYQNRYQVTQCELVGLADLDTSSPHVQKQIVTYLKDLLSVGIDGFRIDAAKHIAADDLYAILSQLRREVEPDPFIYQEVIDPGTEAIKKSEYYRSGEVFEFEYGRKVSEKFMGYSGQNLAQLETLGESWGFAPSKKSIVFIDNHDKQRGHGGGGNYLTYKNGKLYELANVFMLAHPYGHPLVMSSYQFSDSDQGPPSDTNGRTRPVYRNGAVVCQEWVCEHRWEPIAHMVNFRNITAAVPKTTDWWSNGRNQIAFGRGDRGFVVINREDAPLNHTFQTQLPPGTYCNAIQGGRSADGRTCAVSGSEIQVGRDGQVAIALDGMTAVAIHQGTKIQ